VGQYSAKILSSSLKDLSCFRAVKFNHSAYLCVPLITVMLSNCGHNSCLCRQLLSITVTWTFDG